MVPKGTVLFGTVFCLCYRRIMIIVIIHNDMGGDRDSGRLFLLYVNNL